MTINFLFVCGFPSSGTDLLRNILNAHPRVIVGGEFPLLPSLAAKFESLVMSADIRYAQNEIRRADIYNNLGNSNVDLTGENHVPFSLLFAKMLSSEDAAWYGNKTPQSTENIDALNMLFPDAKYIIITRDVRDVALSWRRKWGKDMYLCASRWNTRMARGIASTSKLPSSRYLYVTYESLLTNLESEIHKLCSFLGIAAHPRMHEFHKYVDEIVPGKINFGRAIVSGNSDKWINGIEERHLRRIEEIAWPMMQQLGYKPTSASLRRDITSIEQLCGLLRNLVAIVFIGNRSLKGNQLSYRLTSIRVLARAWWSRIFLRAN